MKSTIAKATPPRGRAVTDKKFVIEAAIKCFTQYGPHRTSMADIADEAGISRKTLYRLFEDRASLIERVLVNLFGKMSNKIADRIGAIKDARSAFLDGMLISVDVAQEDRLFNEIIRKDSNYKAEQLVFRGNAAVLNYMTEFWGPIIELGRKEGLVRRSLSSDQIYQLLMSFHTVLLMRDDKDEDQRRLFLSDMMQSIFTS